MKYLLSPNLYKYQSSARCAENKKEKKKEKKKARTVQQQ